MLPFDDIKLMAIDLEISSVICKVMNENARRFDNDGIG